MSNAMIISNIENWISNTDKILLNYMERNKAEDTIFFRGSTFSSMGDIFLIQFSLRHQSS